jgi:hypothetical protein
MTTRYKVLEVEKCVKNALHHNLAGEVTYIVGCCLAIRRFLTPAEKVEMLGEYRKQLQKEMLV